MRNEEVIAQAFEDFRAAALSSLDSPCLDHERSFEAGVEYADENPDLEIYAKIYNSHLQNLITEKQKLEKRVKRLTEALEYIASDLCRYDNHDEAETAREALEEK